MRSRRYECAQQLALDLTIFEVARALTVCSAGTPITIDGVTRPAREWASLRGLKWQTVKMRRMRGDSWQQALSPALRRVTWMDQWSA